MHDVARAPLEADKQNAERAQKAKQVAGRGFVQTAMTMLKQGGFLEAFALVLQRVC